MTFKMPKPTYSGNFSKQTPVCNINEIILNKCNIALFYNLHDWISDKEVSLSRGSTVVGEPESLAAMDT